MSDWLARRDAEVVDLLVNVHGWERAKALARVTGDPEPWPERSNAQPQNEEMCAGCEVEAALEADSRRRAIIEVAAGAAGVGRPVVGGHDGRRRRNR